MASNLFQRGYLSLLASQFFGAMNDNILKGVLTFMVIDGVWKETLGIGEGSEAIVAMIFTIPFILLSGYGGQVADRFSKRQVLLAVKVAEIPIALVGMIGFWTGNLWITLASLILLTCQSAFFGPAKYGMIPELVHDRDLSRANGTINMMTNIAIILGTLGSGFISDLYSPPNPADANVWLPGTVLTIVAILGLASAVFMTPLLPGKRDLAWDWNPVRTYIQSVKEMSKTKLLLVMLAWGYFYLLAGIALLIVPNYKLILDVSNSEASILLGVMGIAIGVGCAAAGMLSGDRIETRLIPIGAVGLIVFFGLLGLVPPKMADLPPGVRVALSTPALFILGAGLSAGFYIVPLQALLQKMSPDNERGRILATANACSFTFLTVASALFLMIRPAFGDRPEQIFIICSLLMVAGLGFFLWKLRGTGILIGQGIGPDVEIDPDLALEKPAETAVQKPAKGD